MLVVRAHDITLLQSTYHATIEATQKHCGATDPLPQPSDNPRLRQWVIAFLSCLSCRMSDGIDLATVAWTCCCAFEHVHVLSNNLYA